MSTVINFTETPAICCAIFEITYICLKEICALEKNYPFVFLFFPPDIDTGNGNAAVFILSQ